MPDALAHLTQMTNPAKKSLKDADVNGKTVLVRVDFNVPLDEDQNITDDSRIRASLPSITYLVKQGARIVLTSHLGRPKGKRVPSLTLRPVAERLSELLGKQVAFSEEIVGENVKKSVAELQEGDVLLLENVRFDPRETENDPEFAEALADLADMFILDAFGTAHRSHATTVGVAEQLPAYAGFLVETELKMLGDALRTPERPFVVMLGGAKVSDKLVLVEKLMDVADVILVGGGMAFTFLKAKGIEVGKSLCENDFVDRARDLLNAKGKARIVLPTDVVVADRIENPSNIQTVNVEQIGSSQMGLDIGPATTVDFGKELNIAKTVFWNGPMGVFESEEFAKGTFAVAEIVASLEGITIVGGGDSVSALRQSGNAEKVSHVSTGGGASLKFLEGRELPAIATLLDA